MAVSFCLSIAPIAHAAPSDIPERARTRLEASFADVLREAGPMQTRFDAPLAGSISLREQEAVFRQVQEEKLAGKWVAALISDKPQIVGRFETWSGLADFLTERDALIEVWTYSEEGPSAARRLTAHEVAALKTAEREQPTFLTATFKDESGAVSKHRIEWGLFAAASAAAAESDYARYREMQLAVRRALGARDDRQRITPQSQWDALNAAVSEGRISIARMPPRPVGETNLFLAVEYEVGASGNPTNIAYVYREDEIDRRILREKDGRSMQFLELRRGTNVFTALGYRLRPGTDALEPAPSPVLGQEAVQLRVRNPQAADVRAWNLVEFGEPELIRQSALAQFSLISAHLERQRKAIGVKKSSLDLIAEPVIAAISVGAGVAGAPFPWGEAVRLAYNLITPRYIADVPSVKELRELFALLAAKEADPKLRKKAAQFLAPEDIKALEAKASQFSDREIDEFIRSVSDDDLQAMVFLARMRRIDARVTNFLNILTSAAKVSGKADSGLLREIFNNSYVSLNGEWSIKNSLAAILGEELINSRNSVPLEDLVRGRGPAKAWAQYFDFSVDLRALANTLGRIPRRNFAERELYKPLPYALHMGDLAAYEIRVFGFPLFIFYKRGLIKADFRAYQEDYAYGIDGAKILEHFRTREEMDREIRAGRMVPIGYVKVPSGRGGWKDSNLAVFAHRIPAGRHKGKMVLVIYGLKAYSDHSEVIERELKRLRQFDEALEKGGVIEQVIDASDRDTRPAETLEPVLHVGREAIDRIYSTRLANLLEDQRERRLAEWGLGSAATPPSSAIDTAGRDAAPSGSAIRRAGRDAAPPASAPPGREQLVSVDRYYSTFIFHTTDGVGSNIVRMTLIPAPEDVERSARKAEQSRQLEELRRAGLSRQGVIFLNEPRSADGRFEVGPLLINRQGQIAGAGVRTTVAEMQPVYTAIENLPISDRARLEDRKYAATLLPFDADGDGAPENVFVTIEFPPGRSTRREATNALTGELETSIYQNGRIISLTTPRRITEFSYDDSGFETGSRTFANNGGRGPLIEETRTLAAWRRASFEPYTNRITKLRLNYVTGALQHETYGLFSQPFEVVDERFVTINRFTDRGRLESAGIFDNGATDADFNRSVSTRLLNPVKAQQRFALTARGVTAAGLEVERTNLLHRTTKTLFFDGFGRTVSESWADDVAPNHTLSARSLFEYRDDFLFGLIPVTTRIVGPSGTARTSSITKVYDPATRTLLAEVTDYTGRVTTNLWDARWDTPIEIHTSSRVTSNRFDRAGVAVEGTVTARTTGEPIAAFAGKYDPTKRLWEVQRVFWHQPGVTSRVETAVYSAFGTSRGAYTAAHTETLHYSADGIVTNSVQTRRGELTNDLSLAVLRTEDDFRWQDGAVGARVRTFADGRLHSEFRVRRDPEGRTITDGIQQIEGVELRTVIQYDGDSERVVQSEQMQNGVRRALRRPQPALQQTNGTWLLPVVVTPAWGLASTQTFVLGEATPRPLLTSIEDGATIRVAEWFDGTAVPKVTEVRDFQGRLRERLRVSPRSRDAGRYDSVDRFNVSFWGGESLAEKQALLPGTDVIVYSDFAAERVYYDLSRPYQSPRFAVDPHRRNGVTATFGAATFSNVVQFINHSTADSARTVTEFHDVRGLFFHTTLRRTADRLGSVLDEQHGRVPSSIPRTDAFARATPSSAYHYDYAPGWLVEQPGQLGRVIAFSTNGSGIQVNAADRRDFVTSIAVRDEQGVVRAFHSPRWLETNSFLPGRASVWTEWSATEFDRAGRELFRGEHIYDSHGRLAVSKTVKQDGNGRPAIKIVYDVGTPAESELRPQTFSTGSNTVLLTCAATNDCSPADFIYWYAVCDAPVAVTWLIADTAGHRVRLTNGEPNLAAGVISTWPARSGHTLWLPDAIVPRQAAVVHAPAHLRDRGSVVAVCVQDLLAAGIDPRRLESVRGEFQAETNGVINTSHVLQLRRDATPLRRADDRLPGYQVIHHSSGLTTFVAAEPGRTEGEIFGAERMTSVTEFNDLPVMVTHTVRGKAHVFFVDQTADSPRPMYAIWPREGRFLEHYKTTRRNDSEVYAIVQGFELPRVEVFDPRRLADEIHPSLVAYGRNFEVTFRPGKTRGWIGESWAAVQGRVMANTFRFGGEKFFESIGWTNLGSGFVPHYSFSELHNATNQAREIRQLPMLAQSLLSSRDVPWARLSELPAPSLSNRWRNVGFVLGKMRLNYPTGLIPTAPDTAVERYVDTETEADLIVFAIKIGEFAMARELLDFYWQKSQGGQAPLHASYDALSGTAMAVDLTYQRPVYARRTAGAQIAIADAAFTLGLQTGEAQWITLGRNLLDLVLDQFRPPRRQYGQPRGVTDLQFLPLRSAYGVALWPEAHLYSLRNNARLCLLLKRLDEISDRFADRAWRFFVSESLNEQEAWLRAMVLDDLEQTGVPPKGHFNIQDINHQTTALAPERWTSAADWLVLIETAHALGLPRERTRQWLDNLARVHGVHVDGTWGLDWSVPTLRSDVISTDLTAAFARVAALIEHTNASAFAMAQLARLRQADAFPAIKTSIEPTRALQSGQGFAIYPQASQLRWPASYVPFKELRLRDLAPWNVAANPAPIQTIPVAQAWPRQRTDMTVFVLITAGVYIAILGSAIFWWIFRAFRGRDPVFPDPLVPDTVMQLAEERWARRVLGARTPAGAENSRYSNAPVEANFLMQLRAIYKLIIEWRRQENGWEETDRRIAEDETDEWLNGLDEYACVLGLYMRWVIKAGAKDGFDKKDVLTENEDSNHIWSRLVMYCSEYYWGVLTLLRNYNALVLKDDKANLYAEISQLLSSMALRQRSEPFDASKLFNFPEDRSAMDLLVVQQPGQTLDDVLIEASKRLRVPYLHLVRIVERYKEFKRRERPYPIHPYIIELAKVMPHFLLMGLGALVWYNQSLGDSPIVPYLWSVVTQLALSPVSLLWALPLFASLVLGVATHFVRIYRFDAPMLVREKTEMILDATLTSLFGKRHSVMPKAKPGRWWNPDLYEWSGWVLRAIGYLGLGITLMRIETPSFATFLVVKGIIAMMAFAEVAAIVFPLASTGLSKWLQDYVSSHPNCGKTIRFINRLNITATRPASPLWLSVKYHTQPSVPTGDFWGMIQTIVFYFLLGAVFFFAGGYLCQQIFSLWFMDTYLNAANWKLFFGGLLFWNTMYLLRYGLFFAFTGVASALVTFPIKTTFGLLAAVHLLLTFFGSPLRVDLSAYPQSTYSLMFVGLVLMVFEGRILCWLRDLDFLARRRHKAEERRRAALDGIKTLKSDTLGVVYMSGDDLSHQKLTPDLLMERWTILRDRLGSEVIGMFCGALGKPDDAALRQWFEQLYAAEKRADATLWHPSQLVVAGEQPRFAPDLGLNIPLESAEARNRLIAAWHVRRWLVSMMSTAGHSQDTAINLVDIALRLSREGLAENSVFYLVQNKYDNNDNNRPSQSAYDRGELGHRNKLARLLMAVAPGARAYNLQNWTPFGFKAGGLTGMDLVHEEALKLSTMIVLDRNATVHDLDGLIADITTALTDPDVVIIIPGRGTTNTLTSVGQGSQMVEEGHRSYLKGLMGLLGGRAAEAVGTGWGNLLACYYGRVQRALTDAHSPKMPLTSRMRRGSSFAVRAEGLIGFAPHAVGISEDTWAVSQTAHNAIALGRRVKFLVSKAIWHKIRETWSHSEWLASFPRWSGGYLQMMHDPIMQRVNDFGAASVFAKEVRANSGRNFLSAPFALLNILFMPLAIMLDITPFIQILIVLWNFGFVMNQILTVHGLNTYLEGSGFYRIPALLGAAIAGAAAWFTPGLQPFAPGLIVAGFLLGGFFVGVSRWIYTRLRDMLLFGPQLVLHALGQVVRQTLEFTVSGASPQDARGVNMAFRAWAGPREDRPWEGYPNFMNLKTVIWLVGLLSVILNLFALTNLDMLNVLLLLPSLLFSASALLGPFLLRPRAGQPIGKWVLVPKLAGWAVAFAFYTTVSMLTARDQWLRWIGAALFVGVFASLLRVGLRYLGYRRRWHRLRDEICELLAGDLPEGRDARPIADALMQKAGDPAQAQATLDKAGVAAEKRDRILTLLAETAGLLRTPAIRTRDFGPLPLRFVSEFGRSLVLALFILIWFFVVPVPGVLVFTADAYRFSLDLGSVVLIIGWIIALVILAAWVGRFLQWLDRAGSGSRSLSARFAAVFQRLLGRAPSEGGLTPEEMAHGCALLTDAQTYLDQRSLAYARQTLANVEQILARADQGTRTPIR